MEISNTTQLQLAPKQQFNLLTLSKICTMWQKKGLVYSSNGEFYWNKTHAQVTCVDDGYADKIRIIYSARDEKGRCMPSYIDVSKEDPQKVLYVHDKPILELGVIGMFDDCGIMPTWLLHHPNGERWLYYIGWTVRNTIPYHNSIGIAVSRDGGNTYTKMFDGPVINTTPLEPLFSGNTCVLYDEGIFKMWYLNCTKWEEINGKIEPFYNIKYGESKDGIHWERNNTVAIDYKDENEGGLSRPCVLKEQDGSYIMWFSYRAKTLYRGEKLENSYRISVAVSADGIHWERKDGESGIKLNDTGWDSEMIAYPMVFTVKSQKYMYYNGNGFGRSGFGLAVHN